MREKILKMLEGTCDLEAALLELMQTAEKLAQGCFLFGELDITQYGLYMNLKEVYDTAESILNEVREMKKEMEEHDR